MIPKPQLNEALRRIFRFVPARVALGILSFFGFINLYMVRVNISVAIVAMVSRRTSANGSQTAECLKTQPSLISGHTSLVTLDHAVAPLDHAGAPINISNTSRSETSTTIDEAHGDEIDWDEVTQGLVLGSFFYGYALTQVVGGRMAELWGTRWVFGGCVLSGAFVSLITPVAASAHYGVAIAVRALLGLFQGASWPSMHALIARWIPPIERPRFVGCVYFSTSLSITLTMWLCGVLIPAFGWTSAFYVPAMFSLLWCVFWFMLMYDHPHEHPRITQEELQYIESSIRESGSSETSPKKIPWKSIFTSLPVWAIIVCDMGNVFGLSFYMNQLPTYMSNIQGFSIKENGLLSGLPFLCRYAGAIINSNIGDKLIASRRLSIRNARRLFSAIAMLIPAALMIGVAYSGCNATVSVILLCVSCFCNGAIANSQLVNHTDIAPNFSGTLFGISNTFASVSMFLAPVVVGAITNDNQTMGQWQKVFWMCVPIFTLPEIFYLIFCSGSVQSWNYDPSVTKDSSNRVSAGEAEPLASNNL